MVKVSYPGVYVQERSSGVRTITGVSTSIAAFFGRTTKGPINRPVRCLNRSDFIRTFGGAVPQSEIGVSLTQFYANGGTDCYVVRLASATAEAAKLDVNTAVAGKPLHVQAKSAGAWGNGVRLEVDHAGPHPGETFDLTVIHEQGGTEVASERFTGLTMDAASPAFAPTVVSQGSDLIELTTPAGLGTSFAAFSEARRPLGDSLTKVQATFDGLLVSKDTFEISVDGGPYVKVVIGDGPIAAAQTMGAVELAIQGNIKTALDTLVPAPAVTVSLTAPAAPKQTFLRITASTTGGANSSVRVRRSTTRDLAGPLLLGVEDGGVEMGKWSDVRPVPNGTVLRQDKDPGDLFYLNALAALAQDSLTSITVGTEPAIPISLQTRGAAELMYVAADGGFDGVREKLRILAQAISTAPGTRYRAEVRGYQLVVVAKDGPSGDVTMVKFGGTSAGAIDPAHRKNARRYTLGLVGPDTAAGGAVAGTEGGALGFADYVGDPLKKTGLYALDGVDLFNLMLIPVDRGTTADDALQLMGPASGYCAARRAFLLIDPPDSWTSAKKLPAIVNDTPAINALRTLVVKDHSAVYFPKIRINDGGVLRTIGPAGSIAGLMARLDASRGVWKAPAGTEADLRGIVGLDVTLTDLENGVLNKLGVNCLRSFVSGSVSWGARTLEGADELSSEWKYVPIRRLALLIEESLYRGTQWAVFEPNDEPLWANIRLNVGVFMNQLFRQGAFQGSTPDQAYFVKCDAETTTQADRNLGIVNIEVGFAPLKPAEFVVLTIQQIAGDLL